MSSTSGPESLELQAQLSRREGALLPDLHRETRMSHYAHLAQVRLRHDGARRQRVYNRERQVLKRLDDVYHVALA
jgi:hypothetical protein